MQYQEQELVFYDKVGICRVEHVGSVPGKGLPQDVRYYTLVPLYQEGTILVPVTTRAYLRRLLTRGEAEELIARLPMLEPQETMGMDAKAVSLLYQKPEPLDSCEALARLAIGVFRRGQQRAAIGRRPAAADQRLRKFAENLLHGELAAVLGVPQEEVPALLAKKVAAV